MTFYITTPIYYVNDIPHIGHAYTTILADILTRYHKLWGEDCFLLTGTDEHGQKVQNAAKARGLSPQDHVDEMVTTFQSAWKDLHIEPNFFIRTTMPFHKEVVQKCLKNLHEKGEIYSSEYEGWYSESEEIFYTEKDLVNGKSPAGKAVQKVSERNYFFRMSKYQASLIKYIENYPSFVQPDGKRSEVLGFLRQPLEDLCISRPKTRLSWGIELPFDQDYVTYVWFDALINYISGIGFAQGLEKEKQFQKYWPEAIHLIGKDILITHSVYWPCMLMALDIPLPKQIFAHGWWLTTEERKMSKSEGPVIRPHDMIQLFGLDSFRYFLCREVALGNDAQFSEEMVAKRINAELAHNLGNLVSRTTNLVHKNFNGKIPEGGQSQDSTKELIVKIKVTPMLVKEDIESMAPHLALGHIVELLNSANKYIDTLAPWKLAKSNLPLAGECLYTVLELLRTAAVLLSPVMPSKMLDLLSVLGWNKKPEFDDSVTWGLLKEGIMIKESPPLFPKIELLS